MKVLTGNQRYAVSIFVTILIVLGVYSTGYADITPMSDRTPQVAEVILNVVKLDYPSVSSFAEITATHLAAPTTLYLNNRNITALESGDFDGLTGLTELRLNNNQLVSLPEGIFDGLTALGNLNLYNNQLSSLPDGIFEGLTSLTTIRLGRNTVDPLLLTVSLEKVAGGQFKAVAPTGTTFDFVLPISVTNGSITGGASSVTILQGSVESETFTVTRTAGTTADVTVDIGTLPSLPRNHYGYALVKSDDLPLTVITSINTTPIFTDGTAVTRTVAENTAAAVNIGTVITATDTENDTLTYTLSGNPDASAFDIDSSTGQLKTKAALDYETKNVYTVTITVSDGSLTDTIAVTINVTDVDEVPTIGTPDQPPTTPTPVQINIAPEFVEGDSTTRVVLENTPAGVNIGTPMSVSDSLGDLLAYTLGGVDADSFDIDSGGQLKAKVPLDYETKRVYLVTITVDDEELFDTITVIIYVIDVNDTVIVSGFVPVADRTPQVRDAIVAAIPGVTDAAQVTAAQLATITNLNLRDKSISLLKTGDFFGLTALTNLNLFSNQLSSLPSSIFDGLTALTTLRLGGNAVDPLPLIVSLQSVGEGEFKAVITTGAPFSIVLPINVTNGSISGGTISVMIPQGSAESASFTVIGTSAKVSFRYLPGLPSNHYGYTLAQSTVCNRTEAVADAIAKAVGVTDCSALTEVDLATITMLDLSDMSIASLNSGDFDGMLSLRSLYLGNNELTGLPSGIFDDLVSLRELFLNSNKLTTLSGGIFSNLTSLTNLYLQGNDLSSLSSSVFDGLSSLKHLGLEDNELTSLSGSIFVGIPNVSSILLSKNKLTSLPAGIFEGLSSLSQLHLSANSVEPLPLVVSLQKVGTNQFKAVVPIGAPFAMTLPVTVQNGTIAGGTTTIMIPIGKVESQPLTVTRTSGTVNAVIANIGTLLPTRPATHNGYAFVKSTTLPIEVLAPLNSAPIFTEGVNTIRTVAENIAASVNIGDAVIATDVNTGDTLTYTLGGTDAAAFDIDSATGQLKTKTALDYETKNAYSIVLTVSDGQVTDTITVTINISNLNEAPVFAAGSSTTHTVAENTAAGENIGSPVSATDNDGDTLSYSLSGTDASSFSIDSTIGQLKTGAALNFEDKSSYTFTITVSDETFTDTITVTINVTDANDAPIFRDGENTSRSVAENTATGNNIGSVVDATDADDDTLTYSLGGTDAGAFSIVSTSGQLRISAALDYETKSSYSVTVSVSDGNGGTDSITVTINVTDVSDGTTTTRSVAENTAANTNIGSEGTNNAPVFADGTTTTRSVAENTAANTNIGSAVSATGADNDTLTYTLGGTDAGAFSIVSTSGQLQTSAALDYETKSSYSVTVSVSDVRGGTDSITVTINVTDVSEVTNNVPVFEDGTTTTRSVAENTAANTNIGSAVSATDADNDTLTYTLGGTDVSSFGIVGTSGQLQTSAALDYETKSSYSVTVSVSDVRGGTDSITVTINVTDVSEVTNNAPVFTEGTTTTRSVAENTAANTNIGSAVSATDADNDTLTYTLGGTDVSSFGIVGTSGQLQTSAALDYETKSSYSVTVSVSDGKGGTDSITVTINVTDVSEVTNNAPVFADGITTTRSVAENTAANTNIGSAVSATDTDNDTLTYTLGGTDAASFSIVRTSGQLQTSASLNYETKTSYTVTVSVSDGNGGSDSITVTINVTDVSDTNRAPTFTDGASTTRSVAENTGSGVNIGSAVGATDADDDTLTYSLGGTDASSFSINRTNGQLRTSASLDYEDTTSYSVTVTVTDGNGGTDSITVTINVTDVNENRAPSFTDGSSTTRSVAENTTTGQNIGSAVAATDADSSDTLNYTLGGTDAASFSIVRTSGQLQTSASLNYETKTSYTVTVSVSDGNGGSDSITVTINVTDVSDTNRAPVFTDGASTTRSVAENTGSGVNIGSAVGATDADDDTLTYSLGGTDASSFSINRTNGQLRTSASLDYEDTTSYSVTVTVTDGNGGTDSITVTINVTDVNENRAPSFTDGSSTTRSVAENTTTGQNIGSAVAATDADSSDTLNYTLGGTDAASFSIVRTSGQLQTSASLNYETKTSYTVTVSVSDGNGGSDSITVTINVTDVSDTNRAPTFTDGASTTRSVAENTGSGVNIGSAVGATDADDDTLTYSLGGTDASSFSINRTNGQLRTSASLDYEDTTSYSVTVTVTDGNGGTDSITVTINVTDVSEATITLISDRAQQVQDAIVAAINGVESASDVTAEHLTAITSLNLNNKRITSLQTGDFDGLTALTTLWLSHNRISDISPLAGLTALTRLYLDDNSISNISPLAGLTALTTLYLGSNSISDISPLDGLTALTTLYLGSNSISDISPLDGLTALTWLYLGSNSISDISPLDGLTALTTLYLGSNSISDISPLDGLTALTTLYLGYNSIINISPLAGLTALTTLYLGSNSIIDISPLAGLTALTTLYLSSNSIIDISPLAGLTALTRLYLGSNSISDYGPLRRLKAAIETSGNSLTLDIIIPEEDNNGAPALSAVPTTTSLLANFPNPFNPETWIPYQLSKSAKVTLTIYNMRGVVVRQLELGHQSAGVYRSRSRAVHWDGRNMFGEKVAAGVYFYTLEAGDFTATRKMLIRK